MSQPLLLPQMFSPPSNIFTVTAPSGAGKSSLVQAMIERDSHLRFSVSCTTRPPRAGEAHGKEYNFVSVEEFERLRGREEFLEWAKVHDHFYGTPRKFINNMTRQGFDVVLEIDWQGVHKVKKYYPNIVRIFVLPPSLEVLIHRLELRGQDNKETIKRRILKAEGEIMHAPEHDYVIINREFKTALKELESIVQSLRLKFSYQEKHNTHMFRKFGISEFNNSV